MIFDNFDPAVSFHGSPTVSPTTVAACVSVFLPPKCPASTYFFALSIAAPPHIIIIANGIADKVAPTTSAPTAAQPRNTPTTIGATTGIAPGTTINRRAVLVEMSTAAA